MFIAQYLYRQNYRLVY